MIFHVMKFYGFAILRSAEVTHTLTPLLPTPLSRKFQQNKFSYKMFWCYFNCKASKQVTNQSETKNYLETESTFVEQKLFPLKS